VRLTGEDLTRILINLVKNSAEALPSGGRIQISLREQRLGEQSVRLELTIEDNGPGIPEENLEKIFESGFSNPAAGTATNGGWPSTHRGLGLAITRSMIEAAGGRITAANRSQGGARFTIELPVTA
jgi:two-component system sensor histidine kinase ChvG